MIIDDRIRALVSKLESNDHPLIPQQREETLHKLIETLSENCAAPEVRQRYLDYAKKQDEEQSEDVELLSYPMDAEGYAHAYDVLTEEAAIWDAWSRYGMVVNKNLVDAGLCEKTMARIRELASAISGNTFSIDDPTTHTNIPKDSKGTSLISRGFFEIYHDDSLAQLRQAVRVYLHHVIIWGRTDLWTTYDRYGVKLAGHPDSAGLPLHVDQNAVTHPEFKTVQGVMALTDCPTERGTFVAVPGSKKLFSHYAKIVRAREDKYRKPYVELDLTQSFAKVLQAHRQVIPLRSGSMVSWDSRTTHANSPNTSGEARMVAYTSAAPAAEYLETAQEARKRSFDSGVGLDVRDALMHATKKPRFTDETRVAQARQPERLNALGKVLYGFERHRRPNKSKARLLLNAEAYGFGPTAAIADFYPGLRTQFEHIGFVGPKHTLDLQYCFDYDEIHDQDTMSQEDFEKLVSRYDVFFTSFDFERAETALKMGKPVIVYDCLAWFWEIIPPVLSNANVMYITQDFFGVKERIETEASSFYQPKITPPILKDATKQDGNCVLINLGGIKNPHWTNEDVVKYAKMIIASLDSSIPSDENVIIAASQVVSAGLNDPRVKTYTREQINALLPHVKYAAVTPGLSNIYDMALHNIPTLYLPPANDSQGMQAQLMCAHGMGDDFMDWEAIGHPVQYEERGQPVLKQIGDIVLRLNEDTELHQLFDQKLSEKMHAVAQLKTSASAALIDTFGKGGIAQVVKTVRSYADYKVPYENPETNNNNASNKSRLSMK